jgi:hypothetical protein
MRYMMMVKANADSEAGRMPAPALMQAIGKLSVEMIDAGVLLDTGGLAPSSQGARIHLAGGKTTVVDGPFAEAKELIGGYAILKVDSHEEAIEMGRRFMQLHAEVMGQEYAGEMEIRQLMDMGPPPEQS